MSDLRCAFYGDDVTGSVDALLQFARHGLNGRLFIGMPADAALRHAASECAVVGIAGIARSLDTDDLDAEVRPALTALAALEPAVVQYKACSTVDSSPRIGSLGRVLEIGRDIVGAGPVPLLFAQPGFGRYTAFGHHFAAEGGVVHRLDRQPTMSTHPSTPMTESDLARHLARQTALPIGAIPFTAYTDAGALAARISSSPDAAVVLDALDDAHLRLIGAALGRLPRPVFAIGSGGLSTALASDRPAADLPHATAARGPVLVVSGSRSPQTRRQADAAARAGWAVMPLALEPAAVAASVDDALRALASGRSVALTSDDVAADAGADVLAAVAASAAAHVRAAASAGAATRIVVCGGDTSSRVIRLLGVESLSIAANPWDNVVLLRTHAADAAVDGLEVALKGGQVGADDLFEQLRTLDR
ncbi:four-carbon acid sugar kinase family protein [Microbacterium sp. SSM24]|uniref:four-carbon acid sugar kinase family protein n=1 Tax=Microbacterium sp. SSM24 TaxID=2991714 RepID=UPI002227B6FA|nr:four-carbon acid sugar kinase family protein [Microbacterium sp. SSM24]MCW3493248.1 four-carbon acid sugar kinase family protein [Microbacterium sp. SSM24]